MDSICSIRYIFTCETLWRCFCNSGSSKEQRASQFLRHFDTFAASNFECKQIITYTLSFLHSSVREFWVRFFRKEFTAPHRIPLCHAFLSKHNIYRVISVHLRRLYLSPKCRFYVCPSTAITLSVLYKDDSFIYIKELDTVQN